MCSPTGLGRRGQRAWACRPARSVLPSHAAAAVQRLNIGGLGVSAAADRQNSHASLSCCAQPQARTERAAAVHSIGPGARIDCRRLRSPPIAIGSSSLRVSMAARGWARPPSQRPVRPAAANGSHRPLRKTFGRVDETSRRSLHVTHAEEISRSGGENAGAITVTAPAVAPSGRAEPGRDPLGAPMSEKLVSVIYI